MTPTPHGQVPEALRLANLCSNLTRYSMDAHLIAAELRRQHARIAELEAVGAGGVQALSAAPGVTSEQRRLIGVIADKIEDGTLFQSGIYPKKDLARFVRTMVDTTPTAPAASPTPPAEQDAPKAAPQQESTASNESAYQRGYMDGMAKGRRDAEAAPQQEAQEPVAWQSRTRPTWGGNTRPWSPWEPCTKGQAEDCWKTPLLHDWAYEARALTTAPQPAPHLPERDASLPAERQGLFRKFVVGRVDGSDKPGGKHHGCTYFVLDVDHDPCARPALAAYAAACESTHPTLAADLRTKWGVVPAPQPAPAPLSDDAKDAARYRWLREGNDAKHGAAWHVAVNLYGCEWDAAIDAARKQGASHDR